MLALYRIDTNNVTNSDVEMFTRQTDGSVKPVSTKELNHYKKEMMASLTFFQVMEGGATNRVKDTIVSPDRKLKAIIFSRDVGALVSFNRQVVVVENSQASFDYDPDAVLLSITADGTASKYLSKVTAYWASKNELHIRYPVGGSIDGPQLARTNAPPQSIKVKYESFKVK
jgi:hypothetical protein